MEHAVLHTEKLCKTFTNGGVQQHVIKNLDLEIQEEVDPALCPLRHGQAHPRQGVLR